MRKGDEDLQGKIELLIEQEADVRERTRLLILYQICGVLIDNVVAVREITTEFKRHREDFETHVEKQMSLYNRGKGMWAVVAVSVIVIQSLALYIVKEKFDELDKLKDMVAQTRVDVNVLRERQNK